MFGLNAARLQAIVDADIHGATANLTKVDTLTRKTAASMDRSTKQAAAGFAQVDKAVGNMAGGLGGMAMMMGVSGLVALATGAVAGSIALVKMGEESAQIEARFIGLGGGALKAKEALKAMDEAIGGAMTRDEKMGAIAQITSLELSKSAEETANLVKWSLTLGDATVSQAQRIDSLTQVLVTGRTQGLRAYGISAAEVEQRAKELMETTAGLSDLEAKQAAIKEQLAAKYDLVSEAGGKAATKTQELGKAWEDLKDRVADSINASVVIDVITNFIRKITPGSGIESGGETFWTQNLLGEGGSNTEAYERALKNLAEAKFYVNWATKEGTSLEKASAAAKLSTAQAAASVAFSLMEEAAGTMDVHKAMEIAASAIDAVTEAQSDAAAAADAFNKASFPLAGRFQGGTSVWDQWQMGLEQSPEWKAHEELLEKTKEDDKTRATAAASSYESAMKAASSRIGGYISEAMGIAKGLFDVTGGNPNAAGKNGAFENLYRGLDVAKLGEASPWAAVLGMSQEEALRLTGMAEKGLWTPEVVKAFVNVDALVAQAKEAKMAETLTNALADQVAKAAGVDNKIARAIIGTEDSAKAAGKSLVEKVAEGAKAAKLTAVSTVEDIARAMMNAMQRVLTGAVIGTVGSSLGVPASGFTPGAPSGYGASSRSVYMGGDTYHMFVSDVGVAVSLSAQIASYRRQRLDTAMGAV